MILTLSFQRVLKWYLFHHFPVTHYNNFIPFLSACPEVVPVSSLPSHTLQWFYPFPFSVSWSGTCFITPQSHIVCSVSLLLRSPVLHRHLSVSHLCTDWSQRRQMQRQSVHTTRKTGNCHHAQGFWILFMADVHTAECVQTRVRKCFNLWLTHAWRNKYSQESYFFLIDTCNCITSVFIDIIVRKL